MIWKALLLDDGAGVEQDLPKAAELLHRAAISGDPAYGPVGKMHYATVLYLGRGVTQDRAEAMKWFQAAAAEGNPEAKDFLATNYHTGYRDQQGMGAGTPTSAALAPLANAVSEERHAVPALRRNAVAMRADQGTSAPILPPASPLPPATAITPTTPPQAIQGQQLALRTSPTPSSATGASVLLIALLLISFAFGALRKKRAPGTLIFAVRHKTAASLTSSTIAISMPSFIQDPGRSLEHLMFGLGQLFLLPTLLTITALFLYAFYALGAFSWQAWQRRQGDPAGFELQQPQADRPAHQPCRSGSSSRQPAGTGAHHHARNADAGTGWPP